MTVAFSSIRSVTSRQIFNNGHSTVYVSSAVYEFVSRRLPVASSSPAFYRPFWHPHRESDPNTEYGSHWLAIHFESKSHPSYYFDFYGLPLYIPAIQSFTRRNCSLWDYNSVQLQGPTSTVCGKYCCFFALYLGRGYSPKQFVGLLARATADKLVSEMFDWEFGPLRNISRGWQCSGSRTTT